MFVSSFLFTLTLSICSVLYLGDFFIQLLPLKSPLKYCYLPIPCTHFPLPAGLSLSSALRRPMPALRCPLSAAQSPLPSLHCPLPRCSPLTLTTLSIFRISILWIYSASSTGKMSSYSTLIDFTFYSPIGFLKFFL